MMTKSEQQGVSRKGIRLSEVILTFEKSEDTVHVQVALATQHHVIQAMTNQNWKLVRCRGVEAY